jgi:hypothetical protein
MLTPEERYTLGLLTEEINEAGTHIGRALRFDGLDTLENEEETSRQLMIKELGHILAAIKFAGLHDIIDNIELDNSMNIKLRKLLNVDEKDNLGRQLAPSPKQTYTEPGKYPDVGSSRNTFEYGI